VNEPDLELAAPELAPIETTQAASEPEESELDLGFVEPGRAVGPLRIGMSAAQVEAELGEPTQIEEFLGRGEHAVARLFYLYDHLGVDISFVRDSSDTWIAKSIFVFTGIAGGYESVRPGFRGFDPAAPAVDIEFPTKDDVLAMFGPPPDSGELPMAPIPSTWLSYETLGFDFVTGTGELISLHIKSENSP
jgi:hypothetical protein